MSVQNLRDQQTQFPVAQNRYGFVARDRNLIENFARRSKRLNKYCFLI